MMLAQIAEKPMMAEMEQMTNVLAESSPERVAGPVRRSRAADSPFAPVMSRVLSANVKFRSRPATAIRGCPLGLTFVDERATNGTKVGSGKTHRMAGSIPVNLRP
jgi:hypothetical protein